MELSDYWNVMRRWALLIAVGTIIAGLIGYGVMLRQSRHAISYQGTATVRVNYVTPPGAPYNPTISVHTDAVILSDHVADSAALAAAQKQAHVAPGAIQSVRAAVDPDVPLITVQAVGAQRQAVSGFALALARYLAGLEEKDIDSQLQVIRRERAADVAATRQAWLSAQQQFYTVCGCTHFNHRILWSPTQLANLKANLLILSENYQMAMGRYSDVSGEPEPAATALPGSTSSVAPSRPSPLKTVVPAILLGFLLSVGLAALLEYLRPAGRGAASEERIRQQMAAGAPSRVPPQ